MTMTPRKTVAEMIGHSLRRMASYFLAFGLLLLLARGSQPSDALPADFFTTRHSLEILAAGVVCFMLGSLVERACQRVAS